MTGIPLRAQLASFLRSFLIQASWNYRTMIGGGFAFAILPVLRWLHRKDVDRLIDATGRHTEHFNAHPYLAGLAIGAAARLEADGADPDAVRRFKAAVRGPLGGLGDRLFWAGWLPTTLLIAIVLAVSGAGPGVVVVTFLVLYNAGHLALRIWAFRTGVSAGTSVARRIQAAHLNRIADRIQSAGSTVLGMLAGLLAMRALGAGQPGWLALGFGGLAFVVGARIGQSVWRPMAAGIIVTTVVLTLVGALA